MLCQPYLLSLQTSIMWPYVLTPIMSAIFPFFTDIYDVIICADSYYVSHISFLYKHLWCDHMCWLLLCQPCLLSLQTSMMWPYVLAPIMWAISPFFTNIFDVTICAGCYYVSHISFLYKHLWCDHMCWLLLCQPYLLSLQTSMMWPYVLTPIMSAISPFFTNIYDVTICAGSYYLSHISFLYRHIWCNHMCWVQLSLQYLLFYRQLCCNHMCWLLLFQWYIVSL